MSPTIYNPRIVNPDELPVIYGFSLGGHPGFMVGQIVTQHGQMCGKSPACANELLMAQSLGVDGDARPDRHAFFRQIYPDGYRTEFVGFADVDRHARLQMALAKSRAINAG